MKATITKIVEGEMNLGNNWLAICETHFNTTNAKTRQELAGISTTDFCDCCTGDCTSFCRNCNQHG